MLKLFSSLSTASVQPEEISFTSGAKNITLHQIKVLPSLSTATAWIVYVFFHSNTHIQVLKWKLFHIYNQTNSFYINLKHKNS